MKISLLYGNLWLIFFRREDMCCNNFGIGLIVLSITLLLGITISEFLNLKDVPEVEIVQENVLNLRNEKLTNCVPKDVNLEYQYIFGDGKFIIPIKKAKSQQNKELKSISQDKSELVKKLKKQEERAANYNSSFQTLVFSELCQKEKFSQ